MKLIDADAFKSRLKKQDARTFAIEELNLLIDFAPIIDAVPVVRCKDCIYWEKWNNLHGSCERLNKLDIIEGEWFGADADDYCSFGERKGDE